MQVYTTTAVSSTPPADFEAVGGRGIGCTVNGAHVLIGNPEWLTDKGVDVMDVSVICPENMSAELLVVGEVLAQFKVFSELISHARQMCAHLPHCYHSRHTCV